MTGNMDRKAKRRYSEEREEASPVKGTESVRVIESSAFEGFIAERGSDGEFDRQLIL
jgi:hypothetical protein